MLCFILFLTSTFAFDCLNEVGKPVDSWVILKHPQGTVYFYYDSSDKIFQRSSYSLNDSSSGALSHTIKQLWHEDANYVLYNDQVPLVSEENEEQLNAGKFGHTKGLFAFSSYNNNNNKGFWLTHSVPLFPIGPLASSDYIGLSKNAWTYAQHLMCLSLTTDTINKLALAFQLNRPQIYESRVNTIPMYANIRNLIDGHYSKEQRCDKVPLVTHLGMPFTVYAKTAEWNNDLYSGCVTPSEADTLWVESWIRGSAEGPTCPFDNYDTLDIKSLDFAPFDGIWSETQDHSKWAITRDSVTVCMGDINRMTTQYSRGGGTACFVDTTLHSILKKATTKTNNCFT